MIVIAEQHALARHADPQEILEQHAYRFGRTYDSYLTTEPERQQFWSRRRQGVVSFVRVGRYLQIGGGLLAADEDKPALLDELTTWARERRLYLSFYNLLEADLPLFRRHGFQVTKWGEEALVDLPEATWQGKAFEWVRRQSNYCQRKGLVISEYRCELLSEAEDRRLLAEMKEIAAEPLKARPQHADVRFVEGAFDPLNLGRKRLFLARSLGGAGRIEGLLVCNPGEDGSLWAFELYRHRSDSVRGTVAFLMHQVMQLLQEEGVQKVSMCLIPGQNCGEKRDGDSSLARWSLLVGSRYFGFLFDTAGVAYFKSRFRPRYEDRFIGAWPRQTFGSGWAFIRALGVLDIDCGKTLRLAGQAVVSGLRKLVTRKVKSEG